MTNEIRKALIYCQVASKKQLENAGLDNQEHQCQLAATERGLGVEAIFHDHVSGRANLMERGGMVGLIRYLEAHSDTNYVVIFDDIKRLSRNISGYIKLKVTLKKLGATLLCLNHDFEETPDGRFIETLMIVRDELKSQKESVNAV